MISIENSPKVSVIIPCYGAKNTLKNLASDLLRQTFTDFEAIFVNDGDDRQSDILNEISLSNSRFKVVNKSNGGVSSARNAGLEAAKGEYIVFVDADDNLYTNALQILTSNIGGAGIVIAGYTVSHILKSIKEKVSIEAKGELNIGHAIAYIESNVLLRATWSKLYKRGIIESYRIRFNQEFCIAEDWLFNLEYLQHVNKVSFVSDSGYIYNIGQNGNLSSNYDKKHVEVTMCWINMLSKIWEKVGITDELIKEKKDEYYGQLCFSMLKNLYCNKNGPSFIDSIDVIKKQLLYDDTLLKALKRKNNLRIIEKIQRIVINTHNAFLIACFHFFLYAVRDMVR